MKITLDIPDDEIRRALANANIDYWGSGPAATSGPDSAGRYVLEHHGECESNRHTCHHLDLERGLRMMYQRPPEGLQRSQGYTSIGKGMRTSMWDAAQCDAFVQYAAFGELRYG